MIHHVLRVVSAHNIEDCVRFYGLLGFAQVPVPPGIEGRSLWLEHTGTQLHLMPAEDPAPEAGHVALIVSAYDATLERLRAEGHDVEPRREHWGSPRAYVRDPAGHLVELMAWPPGTAENRR